MHRLLILLVCSALPLSACGDRSAAAAPPARRATHVDSILPRAEALRRFQASARPIDSLTGGTASRDALVRAFVHAVETRDTAGLRRLSLDRNEFAFLYYPTAAQGLPPYDLAPDLLWFLLQNGSEKGLTRALASRGGRRLGFRSYRCDTMPSREGANLLWGPCVVRHRQAGVTVEERLFGLIVERDGRFKFVSYGNKL
jgi:hypothetical protein